MVLLGTRNYQETGRTLIVFGTDTEVATPPFDADEMERIYNQCEHYHGNNELPSAAVRKQGVMAGASNGKAVALLSHSFDLWFWGNPSYGGRRADDPSRVIQDVDTVVASSLGFAVLKHNRLVETWGNFPADSVPTVIRDRLKTVITIIVALAIAYPLIPLQVEKIVASPTQQCFAAILEDGKIATWGGDSGASYCRMTARGSAGDLVYYNDVKVGHGFVLRARKAAAGPIGS